MLKIRASYYDKQELDKLLKVLKENYNVLYVSERGKSRNPKYANSQYKLVDIEVEEREE